MESIVEGQKTDLRAELHQERSAWSLPGLPMLILFILVIIACVIAMVASISVLDANPADTLSQIAVATETLVLALVILLTKGIRIIKPNEACVLTFFGKYIGTLRKDGIFFVNPFSKSESPYKGGRVSLKTMTLSNEKQKINDLLGNPIEISIVVIWRVVDTAKAVFDVDDYERFLSVQADSALRNIVRKYPYDSYEDASSEKSLRASSQEIAEDLKAEIQQKVVVAGIEVFESRITHLAYSPEIAAAMLQRQQASAIVDARQLIVEGAVGMVQSALEKLSEREIVELDEEKKAQMVCNLLVVLCGNKDPQPIVNSGTPY